MSSALSIGLIGIGGIGAAHLTTLTELEAAGQVRLVAVAESAATKFAQKIAELQTRGVRWYPAYSQMLDGEKLDAVVIATPIFLHAEMTRKCIERGLFVYLEKPPVPLIQQLDELISLDQCGRVHLVFQMISSEFIQQLKQSVIAGNLGKIHDIRISACWPRPDSYYSRNNWAGKMALGDHPILDGPATNALAHLLHNAMFLAGENLQTFGELKDVQAEFYRVRPIESYDLICLRGTFPSGIKLVAALTHATQELRPFRLRISGTKGWAEISKDGEVMESSFGRQLCPQPHPEAWGNSYQNFIAAVNGQPSRSGTRLKDTLGYVKATNGALLSSGEIFTIAPSYSRTYGKNGDRIYDVPGLTELMERSYQEGLLFSELGAPWAKSTPVVPLQHLTAMDIREFIAAPMPCAATKV